MKLCLSLLFPAVIVGALPNNIQNGQLEDAVPVMANLTWIVNQVNANATPVANTALLNAANSFTQQQSGIAATSPANFPIASQVQNLEFNTLSSELGTNTITARISALPLTQYVSGQVFIGFPSQQNTGPANINIDTVGLRSILNAGSALTGGELRTVVPMAIAYDATANAFDLINGTPYVQGPNIPSAATLNLDAQNGDYHQIDGTANVTAITLSRGRAKLLEFTSSPLLSQSGSLILGSNVTPSPGDVLGFRGEASGVVRLTQWDRTNFIKKKMTRTVLTSGSGIYIPPIGCIYYNARLVGPGGGGGSDAGSGSGGTNTTFGPMVGGIGGAGITSGTTARGADGGTASGGDVNIKGGDGGSGNTVGGVGGTSYFGGNTRGTGGADAIDATSGAANSGSGGGGYTGGGGGGGGYCEKLFSPAVPNLYSVGSGGGHVAGTHNSGDGGSGIIVIDEYY